MTRLERLQLIAKSGNVTEYNFVLFGFAKRCKFLEWLRKQKDAGLLEQNGLAWSIKDLVL